MITNIGKHRVQHGNIMDGVHMLMNGDKADLIYSDPPWGQANLRYWKTINKRMTGDISTDVIYSDFLPYFFNMCFENSKDKVIIEYGCQWSKDIEDNAVKSGFTYQGKVICYYGTGNNMRPCDIHFMTKSSTISFTDEFIDLCKEKRDLNLVSYIFDYVSVQEGDICFDPMCGMGFTAQAAMKNRMQFRGNELNKARLNKTIKKLERGV